MDKLLKEHSKAVNRESQDVYLMSLELYKSHLLDLEKKDLDALSKQLADLRRLEEDLILDMEDEETKEEALLGEREELWTEAHPRVRELRGKVQVLVKEIGEIKESYKDVQEGRETKVTTMSEEEERDSEITVKLMG